LSEDHRSSESRSREESKQRSASKIDKQRLRLPLSDIAARNQRESQDDSQLKRSARISYIALGGVTFRSTDLANPPPSSARTSALYRRSLPKSFKLSAYSQDPDRLRRKASSSSACSASSSLAASLAATPASSSPAASRKLPKSHHLGSLQIPPLSQPTTQNRVPYLPLYTTNNPMDDDSELTDYGQNQISPDIAVPERVCHRCLIATLVLVLVLSYCDEYYYTSCTCIAQSATVGGSNTRFDSIRFDLNDFFIVLLETPTRTSHPSLCCWRSHLN
jgi:hypothetical protein